MTGMNVRSCFETWASRNGSDCRIHESGEYNSANTQQQWLAWTAALSNIDGYVMMPVTPTDEMLYSAIAPNGMTSDGYIRPHELLDKYFAMVCARPTP